MTQARFWPAWLIGAVGLALPASADFLEVTRDDALLFSSASTDGTVREELEREQLIDLHNDGQQRNGFYRGETENAEGWVHRNFVRRHPGILPGSRGPEHEWDADDLTFMGIPAGPEGMEVSLLENVGYAVGYSETRRGPLWSAYRLFPVGDVLSHARPSKFKVDENTTAQIDHDCYTHNGQDLDRGHMAPNHAIDSRFGRAAQRGTFLMSNVAPQKCGLNREPWQAFERVVADEYAQQFDDLFVVTGPIYPDAPEQIACDVQVPQAFFKVVMENELTDRPRLLPIVMVQEDTGFQHTIRDFVTTVDCIELLTGLDLFHELQDPLEEELEATSADEDWNLDQVLSPSFSCPGGTQADVASGNQIRQELLAVCDP